MALALSVVVVASGVCAGLLVFLAVLSVPDLHLPVMAGLLLLLGGAGLWVALLRSSRWAQSSASLAEAQQRLAIAEAIRDIGLDILTRTDLDDVLHRVVGHARGLLTADLAAVAAPNQAGTLRWAAVAGNRTDAWERLEFDQAAGVTSSVLADGRSIVVGDVRAARRSQPGLPVTVYEAEGLATLIVTPLARGDGHVTGALLAGFRVRRTVSPAELRGAEVLANQSAIALYNARLIERLRQAERVKDEFLSRAAHELKTPVTSIRGFAQLTLRQLERANSTALDAGSVHYAMRVIDGQSDRLARLVSQLLDVSRMTAGRFAVELHPTDLAAVVRSAVGTVQVIAANHTLLLTAPMPVMTNGDASRLEQVVISLLDNAIKFSPRGGPIEIVVSQPDALTASLSVTDQGIGVPMEYRQRIFDRAEQAHSGQHFAGLGLGLSISREIVQLHGGQIVAEFPEVGGTRVVVTLPALAPVPTAEPLAPAMEEEAAAAVPSAAAAVSTA